MKTIWKYPMISSLAKIHMPAEAEILSVQVQNGCPHIWALVDTDNPPTERMFEVVVTGGDVKHSSEYLGTFQNDWFVGHLFERTGW